MGPADQVGGPAGWGAGAGCCADGFVVVVCAAGVAGADDASGAVDVDCPKADNVSTKPSRHVWIHFELVRNSLPP